MANKKTTKKATTAKATKDKKAEPTFNSVAAALNAPLKKSRPKADAGAAKERASAKSREIDARLAEGEAKSAKATEPEAKQAEPTKGTKRARKAADAKPKKLSAIDAAAQLLSECGTPMSCKALVEAMAEKGLWTSPAGRTPAATLYSSILREIANRGRESRFKKVDRGLFAAS